MVAKIFTVLILNIGSFALADGNLKAHVYMDKGNYENANNTLETKVTLEDVLGVSGFRSQFARYKIAISKNCNLIGTLHVDEGEDKSGVTIDSVIYPNKQDIKLSEQKKICGVMAAENIFRTNVSFNKTSLDGFTILSGRIKAGIVEGVDLNNISINLILSK